MPQIKGVGRESERGRESGRGRARAWGSESGWAGKMYRQEEWMDRERGWARRVDGAGRVAHLIFFGPLPTFESLQ